MKPREVQRSVRTQRIERVAGDAPSLGRVSRIPGTGLSGNSLTGPAVANGLRRRRRKGSGSGYDDETRKKRQKIVLMWSLVFMMGTLCVLGSVIWLWVRSNAGRGGEMVSQQENGQRAERKQVTSAFESPTEQVALETVKKALLVRDSAEVGNYFRPCAVSADQIVDFLKEMKVPDGPTQRMDWLGSMDANGLLLDGVVVNSVSDKGIRNRLALLTPDEKGHWKIDFEAFARTANPSWEEFLGKDGKTATVRLIVSRDSYYNGVFKDEYQWLCYSMVSPDHEGVFLGYCRRNGVQATAVERIIAQSNGQAGRRSMGRVTLEIKRVEGAEARQFEISRVLAEDWVIGPKLYDETVN